MAVYIPMSRIDCTSLAEFQQVATHCDPEVHVDGCINCRVQVSGVSNVTTTPVTCRDTVEGKVILCEGCQVQYQRAKEAKDEELSSENFIYLTEDDWLMEETRSFKERAIEWAKAHPLLAVAGGVIAAASVIGVVAGLGGYLSRSSGGSVDAQEADTSLPTTNNSTTYNSTATEAPATAVTTAVKPTRGSAITTVINKPAEKSTPNQLTKPALQPTIAKITEQTTEVTAVQTTSLTTKQKVIDAEALALQLCIDNAQDHQVLNVQTKQTFLNESSVIHNHTVPTLKTTQLIFDINKKHHKDVEITYTDHFEPPLRKYEGASTSTNAPITYSFDRSLFARDFGKSVYDKNGDGTVKVAHTVYADNGYYLVSQNFEGTNGRATPPVTTKDMNLVIENKHFNSADAYFKISEQRDGKWLNTKVHLGVGHFTTHKIRAGTQRFSTSFNYNDVDFSKYFSINSYWASQVPVDVNNNLCLSFYAGAYWKGHKQPLKPGTCGK